MTTAPRKCSASFKAASTPLEQRGHAGIQQGKGRQKLKLRNYLKARHGIPRRRTATPSIHLTSKKKSISAERARRRRFVPTPDAEGIGNWDSGEREKQNRRRAGGGEPRARARAVLVGGGAGWARKGKARGARSPRLAGQRQGRFLEARSARRQVVEWKGADSGRAFVSTARQQTDLAWNGTS